MMGKHGICCIEGTTTKVSYIRTHSVGNKQGMHIIMFCPHTLTVNLQLIKQEHHYCMIYTVNLAL